MYFLIRLPVYAKLGAHYNATGELTNCIHLDIQMAKEAPMGAELTHVG